MTLDEYIIAIHERGYRLNDLFEDANNDGVWHCSLAPVRDRNEFVEIGIATTWQRAIEQACQHIDHERVTGEQAKAAADAAMNAKANEVHRAATAPAIDDLFG